MQTVIRIRRVARRAPCGGRPRHRARGSAVCARGGRGAPERAAARRGRDGQRPQARPARHRGCRTVRRRSASRPTCSRCADSLELGIAAGAGADAGRLIEGMEATLRLLTKAFERAGITVVDPQGQPFNPELHEAMATQASAEPPPTRSCRSSRRATAQRPAAAAGASDRVAGPRQGELTAISGLNRGVPAQPIAPANH